MSTPLQLSPGDVLVRHDEGSWHTAMVLDVESFESGMVTAHVTVFRQSAGKPTMDALPEPAVLHTPIAAEVYQSGYERIGHRELSAEDLSGYIYYLKLTNFPKYAAVTGQSIDELASAAEEQYRRGYALTDEGRVDEALAAYESAIDLLPMIYEAIDNRAFLLKDLKRYGEALQGFEDSLRVHADNPVAMGGRGECLIYLGDFAGAAAVFQEIMDRYPERAASSQQMRDLALKYQARVSQA